MGSQNFSDLSEESVQSLRAAGMTDEQISAIGLRLRRESAPPTPQAPTVAAPVIAPVQRRPSPLRQPGQEAPPFQQGNVAVSGATPEIATDVNAAFGVPVAATRAPVDIALGAGAGAEILARRVAADAAAQGRFLVGRGDTPEQSLLRRQAQLKGFPARLQADRPLVGNLAREFTSLGLAEPPRHIAELSDLDALFLAVPPAAGVFAPAEAVFRGARPVVRGALGRPAPLIPQPAAPVTRDVLDVLARERPVPLTQAQIAQNQLRASQIAQNQRLGSFAPTPAQQAGEIRALENLRGFELTEAQRRGRQLAEGPLGFRDVPQVAVTPLQVPPEGFRGIPFENFRAGDPTSLFPTRGLRALPPEAGLARDAIIRRNQVLDQSAALRRGTAIDARTGLPRNVVRDVQAQVRGARRALDIPTAPVRTTSEFDRIFGTAEELRSGTTPAQRAISDTPSLYRPDEAIPMRQVEANVRRIEAANPDEVFWYHGGPELTDFEGPSWGIDSGFLTRDLSEALSYAEGGFVHLVKNEDALRSSIPGTRGPGTLAREITEPVRTFDSVPATRLREARRAGEDVSESVLPVSQARRAVQEQISFKEPAASLAERTQQGVQGLQTAVFDDLYPIQRFTDAAQQGGRDLSVDENPYLLARLLKGVGGKSNTFIEQGTFGKQISKIDETGAVVPNFKGPGLYQVLRPVREGAKYEDFVEYLTTRRAIELNGQGIETGIRNVDAQTALGELDRLNPEFNSVAQGVYRYQDEVLQYANESGLISNDLLGSLRAKHKNYVPFNRVLDGLESRGFLGKKLANVTNPVRRIKGSERTVINPLESVIKNTHDIVDATDRNQVGAMMARLVEENPELLPLFRPKAAPTSKVARVTAKELGIDIAGLDPADAERLVDIFRPSSFAKNANEVTVLINGQKRFFDVDPDLYKGLLILEKQDLGLFGKFFGAPARWLRAGAILAPDFMVKNPIRDQLTAFTYSRYGFLPGVDWMKGVGQMVNKSNDYNLFRMSGAEQANLVSLDRNILGKTAEQIAKERGFTDFVKNPIEALRIASEFAENGSRLGEFARGIKSGDDPLRAGFNAREVTQDFAKQGTVTRAVNQFIPFFGANVGSWSRLAREFKERPLQASTKAFLGITLPSLLLYSVNRNNPKYQELPQWQKDTFWIIPVPGSDRLLRLPKPFMLGQLFGSMPERFFEFLDRRDPKLFQESIQNAISEGTPGFLPQAALPFIENATNHSFFLDRPIIPRGREDAPAELQYSGGTSEAAKALGSWVNQSPAQLDNIFRAYTGTLGTTLVNALDRPIKAAGLTPNIPDPTPELSDIPVVRSFVVRDPTGSSSESVNRFYDKLEEFEGVEAVYRERLALGQQQAANDFKDKNPEAALYFNQRTQSGFSSRTAQSLRQVAAMMAKVRQQQREIFNSRRLTPQQKRQRINETNQALTNLARQALEKLPRP